MGCSASETASGADRGLQKPQPDPVTVVHEGSAGPYETVTLHSNIAGALNQWLVQHNYAIGADIQPVIDAYEAEGFDFIALRLSPGAGVQQMRPVRVVQPGAVPSLPLRMVAAGTGAEVGITLFVIGEGRWNTKNFPTAAIDSTSVSWNFSAQDSNYAQLRQQALSQYDGWAWITPYATPQGLLVPQPNPLGGMVQYAAGSEVTTTIADAFVRQGLIDEETADASCVTALASIANSDKQVVDPCAADGSGCTAVGPSQIDSRTLSCGPLDDLSVALTGMHPRDVWLTRLEANLPRAALKQDLELEAAAQQSSISNWMVAEDAVNEPCPVASNAAAMVPPSNQRGHSTRDIALTLAVLATAVAALRRTRRPRAIKPQHRVAT
jgi:hypothetical protein